GFFVREVPLAQLGERLDRRGWSEALEPQIEIALHAVLEVDRAARVLALRLIGARAEIPQREIFLRILIDEARHVGGIDDDRALRLEDLDRFGHRSRLIGIQSAAAWSARTASSASAPSVPGCAAIRIRTARTSPRARVASP